MTCRLESHRRVTSEVFAEELLEQLQHQAIQPTKEEEFQQRMDALRSDQPVYNTTAPIQSVDERFEQVQRLMQGGSTPAQAGPSTSAGPPPAAEASTSTGLAAQLGALQAQTLGEERKGALALLLLLLCACGVPVLPLDTVAESMCVCVMVCSSITRIALVGRCKGIAK